MYHVADGVLGRLRRIDEAIEATTEMTAIADECEDEEDAFRLRIEASAIALNAYGQSGDRASLRRLAVETTARLAEHALNRTEMDSETRRRFAGLCHNVASPLYRAKEYDLAMPLFRDAIDNGIRSAHSRGLLAACVFATTGDRQETLALLREAALRDFKGGRIWYRYRHLPEFAPVADDIEFERAATAAWDVDQRHELGAS